MDRFSEKISQTGKILFEETKKASKKLAKSIRDLSFLARTLKKKEQFALSLAEQYINEKDKRKLKALLKQQKATIKIKRKGWSFLISGRDLLPRVYFVSPEKRSLNPDLEVESKTRIWLENLDKKIRKRFYEKNFREFATKAWVSIPQFIAPDLLSPQYIKQAFALQLFSKEPLHILLLSQSPEESKRYFKSIIELCPICSLASHNSLIRSLAKAHNGIFIIEDLAKLNEKRDKIFDAMELGFISFVKPSKTYRFDTNIRVIAGSTEPSFISNFHLILEHKTQEVNNFSAIAQKLILNDKVAIRTADIAFLRNYIKFAAKLDVEIPPELAEKIVNFASQLKEKESELKYPISPKLVLAITRLAKASARMELRSLVEAKDVERAFSLIQKSLSKAENN
jgi:DNA replicative helicase MCM subunit Mcm2 (Cdc46/Mcm family)